MKSILSLENIEPNKSIHHVRNIQLIKSIQHLKSAQPQQVVLGFGAIFIGDRENTSKYN